MSLPISPTTGNHTVLKNDQLRAAYRLLISSSLTATFPSFVRNLDSQQADTAVQGRCAVVKFKENGNTAITKFTSVTHMREFLDEEAPLLFASSTAKSRQLYLLEGLPRDHIEIIGSRLRIPPAVFAAHWGDPATSRGTYDDTTLIPYSPHYFRLRYQQLHQVKGRYPLGLYGDDGNTNLPRWLQILDKGRRFQSSEHHFSYWGTAYGERSWIAVLLLDPVITKARLRPDATQARSYPNGYRLHVNHPENGPPYPRPMSTTKLPPNPADWEPRGERTFVSLFDGTLDQYERTSLEVDNTPQSATLTSRRIALYMWRGYMRSLKDEFHFLSDQMHYRQSPDDVYGWFKTWQLSWRDEVFRKLTFGKTLIEGANAVLRDSLEILEIGSGDNSTLDKFEASSWRSLQSAGEALKIKFETLIAEYIQEGSIQESRSVGRLTKLATILVPFSITTGIFSMGDDYLAGNSKFWVFWAVAIPLVLLVSIAVFTSIVPSLWVGAERLIWKIRERWPWLMTTSDGR